MTLYAGNADGTPARKALIGCYELGLGFEMRHRAGFEYLDGPVGAAFDLALVGVVDKVAANAVAHPHRQCQRMIDPGDVLAEQKSGHKVIRRVLGAWLVRGQVVIFQEAFVDIARTPGLVQEIANAGAAGEQPEETFAPQRELKERMQPGHPPGAVPPFAVLVAAPEAGGTDECRASKGEWRLGHRPGEKFARQRHGQRVERTAAVNFLDFPDREQDRVGHHPHRIFARAPLRVPDPGSSSA